MGEISASWENFKLFSASGNTTSLEVNCGKFYLQIAKQKIMDSKPQEFNNDYNRQEYKPPNNFNDEESDSESEPEDNPASSLVQVRQLRKEMEEIRAEVIHIGRNYYPDSHDLTQEESDAEIDSEFDDSDDETLTPEEELQKMKQEIEELKAKVIHIRRNYVPILQYRNYQNLLKRKYQSGFATSQPSVNSGNSAPKISRSENDDKR